ncbi:MAG: chemotaxis protein CheW [Deltaproteobacteria bacterium]|nr:chemotaxis protein CheW [Deltaproteobacteria bacterium]
MDWTATANTLVRFDVRGVDCHLPVGQVREVLLAPPLTRVFRAPPFLRGVVNIRGEVIPVLDPALLLGLEGRCRDGEPRMLVVLDAGEVLAALASCGDVGVRQVRGDQIGSPPVDLAIGAAECVVGILSPEGEGHGPGLVLDGRRILALPAVAALRAGAAQA